MTDEQRARLMAALPQTMTLAEAYKVASFVDRGQSTSPSWWITTPVEEPMRSTIGVPAPFIFTAAADMMQRRCMDISSGNIVLHGLDHIEEAWREFQPARVGPEAEGIIAVWLDDCGIPRRDHVRICAILLGNDHRWSTES